eukprot:284559_1
MSTYILKEIKLNINSGCSIYICSTPKSMLRELISVFPNIKYFKDLKARKKNMKHNVLAVIVVQITTQDMVEYSVKIQKERDLCLHIFYKISYLLNEYLQNKNKENNENANENINKSNDENKNEIDDIKDNNNLFIDSIDPMTGQSIFSKSGPSIYDEVDGGSRLLKWKIQQIQYCGVLCHPQYGSHIYPSTMFTNHEIGNILEFFNEMDCKSVVEYGREKITENEYNDVNPNQKCCV